MVLIVESRYAGLAATADELMPAAELALLFYEAARLFSVVMVADIERGNPHVVHSLEQQHGAVAGVVADLGHVHSAKLTWRPIRHGRR